MKLIYHLSQINKSDRKCVGGKAFALAQMAQEGLPIPNTIGISIRAYNDFMDGTGLRAQVLMEYHRKSFDQMRWEEMWDCSLRIQTMFAKTPIPSILAQSLAQEIDRAFGEKAVAVRSSAIGEDSAKASFAGLHESYLNVKGPEDVLEHIKLVWASTWSDAAILYRREIGLDAEKSSMAVVIQELVEGQESGVVFGRSPVDPTRAIIEAVYGLNQGLVDGTVEPDRWMIDRHSGRIVSHTPVRRTKAIVTAPRGVKIIKLSPNQRNKPPLTTYRVKKIFHVEKKLAEIFGTDQDVEWTYAHSKFHLLQSRPITTAAEGEKKDDRQWYLTLRRSFDSLVGLRTKIENDIIPGMISESKTLGAIDLKRMTDKKLAAEISKRQDICEKWRQQYWDFCIPFAHGIRLFGMVYNKTVKPENPYEFLDLLAGSDLQSVRRNEKLRWLANKLKQDKRLMKRVQSGRLPKDSEFSQEVANLAEELSTPMSGWMSPSQLQARVLEFIVEMSQTGPVEKGRKGRKKQNLEKRFMASTPKRNHAFALQLLDLARASYRWRDDDNIYLGQIEKRLLDTVQEARSRSISASKMPCDVSQADDVARCLRDPNYRPQSRKKKIAQTRDKRVIPRQLVGQPAGAGLATGPARVIRTADDLFSFKKKEVLVCDAIDPNMTFVVPLASAIIERRGGMLIHGAIIAREYGLPCVTGIPDAEKLIHTGDSITVDGYLGIVTINRKST